MAELLSSMFDPGCYCLFVFKVPSSALVYASQSSYEVLNLSQERSSSLSPRDVFDPQTCLEISSLLVDQHPPTKGIVLRGSILSSQAENVPAHITLQRTTIDTEHFLVVAVQEILDS